MKKSDIKYIALEGGGGKGNAYYGAIKTLEGKGILKFDNHRLVGQVEGISGASAGAITAFFISSGFSSMELGPILIKTRFNDFFDKPNAKEVCIAGKGFTTTIAPDLFASPIDKFIKFIIDMDFGAILKLLSIPGSNELAKLIMDNLSGYRECLARNYGLFSGKVIQETFFEYYLWYKQACISIGFKPTAKEPISQAAQGAAELKMKFIKDSGSSRDLWTFKKHFAVFKRKIIFTSVNFSTGQVQRFSVDTTPDFPISTAVRMSMSLPLIFKPVIINKDSVNLCGLKGNFWEGYWVDGGLFDNAPVEAFADPGKTLLLRLGERKLNNKIDSLFTFILSYITVCMVNGGSGHVTTTTFDNSNIIQLHVGEIGLLDFQLDEGAFSALADLNAKIVNSRIQE